MSDYFSSIADTYLDLTHQISLSSMDIDLISQWQKESVPIFIVLRVLDEVGDRAVRKDVKIRRLSYFAEAVEEAYDGWRDGQVGR